MSDQFCYNELLFYYSLPKSVGKMLIAKYYNNVYLLLLILRANSGGKGKLNVWVMLILQLGKNYRPNGSKDFLRKPYNHFH